ncbi:peptidylprolyl isomerase [Marinobacterium aestuarii]|uniref:Peptidyl-prolyl cis-trans isomerase n=1 Tax=Marinobacterium aestuarii TaxID=1821621 RepID=A0A1A9EXD2_9GAMM|nr:FKBP-type peptidyl-prolyl cis-trans isomerase [Marinobacterium aestuarii]ANG62472.1 peptidylprolyl isomerase [Marinobacterium aestuarii]
MQKRAVRLALWVLMGAVLVGCGDDSDEAAFRAELVDKARNDDNQRAGQSFLASNAQVEGVVTLPSGLQYRVLVPGSGAMPGASSTVQVNYEGMLIDGTVFDSSYARGEPVSFPLNRVIPGWTEGLQLMREGAQWMLYLPSELAYGMSSPTPSIAPNSALVFKVELLAVESSQ